MKKKLYNIYCVCMMLFWLLIPDNLYSQVIEIDSEWLASRTSPYYLDQEGATYILMNDVTTSGTAFAIIARNITFDLNGHTITYANTDPIRITNSDFEESTGHSATGWDLSSAPGAEVIQGHFIGAGGPQVYSGYNSLRFSVPANDQYVNSNVQITLEPNTTYSFSAMMFNNEEKSSSSGWIDGVDDINMNVKLDGGGVSYTLNHTGRTWRGFAHKTVIFTTGEAAENCSISIGISNAAGVAGSHYVYFDDIRIQQTCKKGIVLAPQSWIKMPHIPPDITRFGFADNSIVKNGNIVQGKGYMDETGSIAQSRDGIDRADGVYLYGNGSNGSEIASLNITVFGANARAINAAYEFGNNFKIHDNVIYHNVTTITSRDNYDGYAVYMYPNTTGHKIYNNTIIGGCQGGINTASAEIYNNYIALKSRYTNGFAISAGSGSQIYNNTINQGNGEYFGRGIALGGSDIRVFNNTITVQYLPLNQEYNGYCISGAYGIQLEYIESNVEIFNNEVTANALTPGSMGSAFRLNPEKNISNLYVHDNKFKAYAAPSVSANANSVKIDGFENIEVMNFKNNHLITNSWIMELGTTSNISFRSSIIELQNDEISPLHILRSNDLSNTENVEFIDNRYSQSSSKTAFENSSFMHGMEVKLNSSYSVKWNLNVYVQDKLKNPVGGQYLTIVNSQDSTIFSGITDSSGFIAACVAGYKNIGGIKTYFNPYSIDAGESGRVTLHIDSSMTILICDGNYDVITDVQKWHEKDRKISIRLFELSQNYPNPFNPKTVIGYQLKVKSDVKLIVYDILGREIAVMVNEVKNAGNYSVIWNGTDSAGQQVGSGVYFYKLKTGRGIIETKKMILVR